MDSPPLSNCIIRNKMGADAIFMDRTAISRHFLIFVYRKPNFPVLFYE